MFNAELFTIVDTEATKSSSIEKWIKKVWYIYTMRYSLVIKRNEIGPFVEMWMDLETVSQSEESHRKVNIIINSYMWNLETWYQFRSVAQLCLTLCNPMDCSTPGLPVHHQQLGHAQTHVHGVGDAIQPSHLL